MDAQSLPDWIAAHSAMLAFIGGVPRQIVSDNLRAGITARDNQRLSRRLRQAKLRQNAVVEDTDFRTPRGLDRALFHKLARDLR